MKITYDPEVDAAYISFKKGRTEVTTIHLTEDIAIDLGAWGRGRWYRGAGSIRAPRH